MVQLTRLLFVASLLATNLATLTKRQGGVITIENDIANISMVASILDTQVNGFPASGLAGALAINTDAGNLVSALNKGTTDIKATPGPLSESVGTTIVQEVEAMEPLILTAATTLVKEKPSFAALPIAGIPALILADLQAINASNGAFLDALIAILPPDLQPAIIAIERNNTPIFNAAIAAFSS
ncbi:hydrophobic surface binding protein A-domain-containing protein [Roridomyces roridus]|uniref:Hydrophobic surface binding protein A-domain-containing protein n=1 Tax=Roridomyces roridus TaxID=1738132 RepID=A0AAD7BMA7_9AGAR|nr:hydrophobic surface binding protein A-domain-containing protein [Roridomyces roridus]